MMADNPIDRLYAAISDGDVEATRACLTPDARLWHSFDGVTQDVDTALDAFSQMFANTNDRRVADIHREEIAGGYLQQHVFIAGFSAGVVKAWPVCLVVRVEDDRISRIDEYIDRAGSFSPPAGAVTMPGW